MTEQAIKIDEIKKRAKKAAAGRQVLIVAAAKQQDSAAVRAAICAGIEDVGENRVQELSAKYDEGAYKGARLHFIGRLQSNKINALLGKVFLIHSVDSLKLLEQISQRAIRRQIVQDVLLQVNIGNEDSKGGFKPDEMHDICKIAGRFSGVKVRGLMAIPPVLTEEGGNCRYFHSMRELFIDIEAKQYDNIDMEFLSMGMSMDFEDAIAAGANIVRVGSAIFGARS